MSDLICDNYSLLMVLSRFGISLGFGDKTVAQVCEEKRIDCATFLAIANFVSEDQYCYSEKGADFSLRALMQYLRSSHSYFLDFKFPDIRAKLATAIGYCDEPSSPFTVMIMNFFDDYEREVRQHMLTEESTTFAYVEQLMAGIADVHHNVVYFSTHHDDIERKLTDLKNILIKYLPEGGDNQLLNQVLFEIFHCEAEIASHCHIEDFLFMPAVMDLERKGAQPHE